MEKEEPDASVQSPYDCFPGNEVKWLQWFPKLMLTLLVKLYWDLAYIFCCWNAIKRLILILHCCWHNRPVAVTELRLPNACCFFPRILKSMIHWVTAVFSVVCRILCHTYQILIPSSSWRVDSLYVPLWDYLKYLTASEIIVRNVKSVSVLKYLLPLYRKVNWVSVL